MSDNNTDAKNNNKLVSIPGETNSENLWIIGVSKTHPGLKYYFNSATGVSLWNIRKEDMERAKETMKASGNQPQYINCPEPKDPPPSKRACTNIATKAYSEHIVRHSKMCTKHPSKSGLGREALKFTCETSCTPLNSPSNIVTVNFQQCPHQTCRTLDNTCKTLVQSQIEASTAVIDSSIGMHHCNKSQNYLLGSTRSQNKSIDVKTIQDHNSGNLLNQKKPDNDFFNHKKNYFGILDITPLKMFAKNGVNNDKWYIIPDSNVYLHDIAFVKSVVNSDNQCCLMVPQHVKVELENATKTDLRTKAHFACYYIYKMHDSGLARIDEDNSKEKQYRSNEENILDCYSKLKDENFYVVIISNDIELQKYRNKIYIPIFTVVELKEYLCKGNDSVATKYFERIFNDSQNNKDVNSTKSAQTSLRNVNNKSSCNSIVRCSVGSSLTRDQTVQTYECNENGEILQRIYDVNKKTADAEVQTNLCHTQFKENIHTSTLLSSQNDESKKNDISINAQCCETPLQSIQGKRIKLRRKRFFNKTAPNSTAKPDNVSESNMDTNNTVASKGLSVDKNQEERIKIVSNNNQRKCDDVIAENNLNARIVENRTSDASTMQLKSNSGHIENKNVMFEVTSDTMEQNLIRKCDEWVSRFVQIIEEVLMQVLRKNSYFPPPLNMYEAATCVKKRFINDEDVLDASNNFLNVLSSVCDEKGSINANISPTQYMEMYSFGVYVIDALQGIFNACEDLQSAAESLAKLLNDIQDPDSDISNVETLNCMSQEGNLINDAGSDSDKVEVLMIVDSESLSNEKTNDDIGYHDNSIESVTRVNESNITERVKDKSQFSIPFSNTEQLKKSSLNNGYEKSHGNDNIPCTETVSCSEVSVTSSSRYNLRFRPTMSPKKQHKQSLSEDNNIIESSFCKRASLKNILAHKKVEENHHNIEDKNGIIDDMSGNLVTSINENNKKGCTDQVNSQASDLSNKTQICNNEPVIVRNFVICSEFENRLRNRYLDDDIEELDFEEDMTDYMDESESFHETKELHIDEREEFHGDEVVDDRMENDITNNTEYVKLDFKYFTTRIAQEIKEMSSAVHAFGQNSIEVINSLNNSDDQNIMRSKAEQIHLCIEKLCRALSNISNRDKNGAYNVRELLKYCEFDGVSIDEDQIESYGTFIARCLEQALYLKNTIEILLTAACGVRML